MRFCNNCGNPVKETDKFCSNCGVKLSEISTVEIQKQSLKLKICDLCGEENPIELDECSYCGVGFSGKEKIIEKETAVVVEQQLNETQTSKIISSKPQKTHQLKKKKQQHQTQKEKESITKKLETKHFLLFGVIVVGLISIFLYFSYDISSSANSVDTQKPQQEIQSGIDLNALNEINQLENELKSDPENQPKLLRLANLTHDAGFFEKAINYYDRYLKLNPNDNDAEVDKGVCYFELKQYDKASSIFESVIKKNPKHQIAYLNLGIVSLTKGEVEKAKEFFKKCIELGEHTDAGHRAAELLKSH